MNVSRDDLEKYKALLKQDFHDQVRDNSSVELLIKQAVDWQDRPLVLALLQKRGTEIKHLLTVAKKIAKLGNATIRDSRAHSQFANNLIFESLLSHPSLHRKNNRLRRTVASLCSVVFPMFFTQKSFILWYDAAKNCRLSTDELRTIRNNIIVQATDFEFARCWAKYTNFDWTFVVRLMETADENLKLKWHAFFDGIILQERLMDDYWVLPSMDKWFGFNFSDETLPLLFRMLLKDNPRQGPHCRESYPKADGTGTVFSILKNQIWKKIQYLFNLDYVVGMAGLHLPPYVVIWIIDWLISIDDVPHRLAVKVSQNIFDNFEALVLPRIQREEEKLNKKRKKSFKNVKKR